MLADTPPFETLAMSFVLCYYTKEKGDSIATAIKEYLEAGNNLETFRRDEDTRLKSHVRICMHILYSRPLTCTSSGPRPRGLWCWREQSVFGYRHVRASVEFRRCGMRLLLNLTGD